MKFIKIFKIDTWWKFILLCGIALLAGALICEIHIVNPRYLLGLGLGMFCIGISFFMAQRTTVAPHLGMIATIKKIKHTGLTKAVLYIGTALVGLFFILLVIELLS
jgi:hypothetical protein